MKRRIFIRTLGILSAALMLPIQSIASEFPAAVKDSANQAIEWIIQMIRELSLQHSSIIKKTLNGRKYKRDAAFFYPYDLAVKDPESQCQLFFHAHRKKEYGHFHTFTTDENGELLHLVMISMDKQGLPVALSTVNRWVTGDHFTDASVLKERIKHFKMDHALFPDERIITFVEQLFIAYRDTIEDLFDQRDAAIRKYVREYAREPFEDRDIEIWSTAGINLEHKLSTNT